MNQFREIMIPGDVLDNENLSDGAKILYGKIARLSFKDGYCWASNSFLDGTKSGRNASRFIAELKSAGYIKIQAGKGKNRKITLHEIESKVDNFANSGDDKENNLANSVNNLAKTGEQTSPNPANNLANSGDRTTNITTKRTTKKQNIDSCESTQSMKDAIELSTLLFTLHRDKYPSYLSGKTEKEINEKIKKWAVEVEYLIRLDKKDPEIIKQVILWVKTIGNFWFTNIESGKKLREKFERLYGQMVTDKKSTSPPKHKIAADNIVDARKYFKEAT